jgi:hypothetical protein
MRQLLKYKQLILAFILLLGVSAIALTPMEAVAITAPIDYVADTNPCPVGQAPQSGGNVDDGQYTCCPTGPNLNNNMACLFSKYINPVVQLLSALVGVVVVIMVIMGAIEYSSSAGDPQKATSGRQHITNALLALLAYILLYAFLEFLIPGGFLHG